MFPLKELATNIGDSKEVSFSRREAEMKKPIAELLSADFPIEVGEEKVHIKLLELKSFSGRVCQDSKIGNLKWNF